MACNNYSSMENEFSVNRRDFLKTTGVLAFGALLGTPEVWAKENQKKNRPSKVATNVDSVLNIPRTKFSLPGLFPGKVIQVYDSKATIEDRPVKKTIDDMFKKGIESLTDRNLKESFALFFEKDDVVGIKVNPVGAGIISTHLEVVETAIEWLYKNGIKKKNIIIWDRFDFMLKASGFTKERFPGVSIEGLQTMARKNENEKEVNFKNSLDKDGLHISAFNFDKDVYYWADVEGPKDNAYLNQHVFNGKYSYFGKLITKKLTKIINIPVFKNSGDGISMATKNLGYGAICNTNRLHKNVFFDVCVEVLAFPAIRDKLVLNITDGLKGQYDGGPMPVTKYQYPLNTLFFATDPFALDAVCHSMIVEKRKAMGISVNEHPIFSEYFRYAEKLNLGVTGKDKINHISI